MNFHAKIDMPANWPQHPIITIGGMPITVINRADAADYILASAAARPRGGKPLYLTSANGEVIAQNFMKSAVRDLFAQADQIVADGQPMVAASRYLCKHALPERVATTDLFHDVARRAQVTGQTFYFLGADEVENQRAVAAVRAAYPKLKIAGHSHGFLNGDKLEDKINEINALRPDVLWLAMGVPREQQFMSDHGHKLTNIGVVKTSGGLFNFLSGSNSRAPQLIQNIALEWVWRISQEPKRLFWRYLTTNPIALFLMLTRCS